jgi:uncharacterized protein (TIGR02001 family)
MSKKMSAGRRKAGGLSLGVAVALVASAGMAGAADAPRKRQKVLAPAPVAVEAPAETKVVDFAFGLRAASDYNFRGISQSDRGFSPQGYGELQFFDNFLYAGVAGYGVDLPTKPLMELDLTAGIRPKFGPFTFDFGVIGYVYPDETQFFDPFTGGVLTPRDTDFLEVAGKVSYTWQDSLTLGAGIFHTGDFLGSGADATYFNATAKYVIPESILPAGFAISGEIGRYELGRVDAYLGGFELIDYTYWNAGVSYTWDKFTLDLRYHDTDLNKSECFINTTDPKGVFSGSGRSKWCSEAFIATLSVDLVASQLGIFDSK